MEDKIIAILNDNAGDDVDWSSAETIVDDEMIDSLDMVAIIGDLSEEFDIEITVDDMVPENFNSVEQMAEMINRLQEEQA